MDHIEPPQASMTCESCAYLSDGYRCQRVKSRNYSRKIPDPESFGCPWWKMHRAWASLMRMTQRMRGV